jgi:SET domain-containing protein
MLKSHKLKSYIKSAGKKGRGAFAVHDLRNNEIIEVAPLIVLHPQDSKLIADTLLNSYVYGFGRNQVAIALGHASLYNHSNEPNAKFSIDEDKKTITIITLRAIQKDEEILIHYGYSLE